MFDLITDRSQADVINNRPKGNYNYIDLNRIENACNYLQGVFNSYGYRIILNVKKDWQMTDFPTQSEMVRFLSNVRRLVEVYYVLPNTPVLPISIDRLTYIGANNIEKNLRDMETVLTLMSAHFRYNGELFAGEDGL